MKIIRFVCICCFFSSFKTLNFENTVNFVTMFVKPVTFVGLQANKALLSLVVVGGAGGVRRSAWCCQLNKRQDTVDVFFWLCKHFIQARRDVLRNSSAAAVSCAPQF